MDSNYDPTGSAVFACTDTSTTPTPRCSSGGPAVVSGTVHEPWFPTRGAEMFAVEHVLTRELIEIRGENYWRAGRRSRGEFILDLCRDIAVDMIKLVNTHNAGGQHRATKDFRVYLSNDQNGPWTRVLSGRLEDSRHKPDPLPVMKYQISPTVARYVKFELYSWYGQGGGLQYFAAVKCSGEY